MPSDAVLEIKSRLDIVEVVGGYVRLQRSGRSHKGLCPFHGERTPSFHVDGAKAAWYCFGCHEGGDVFDFVERIEHVDFRQALRILAERAGVELEQRGGGEGRERTRRRRRALELSALAQQYYEYVLWSTPVGEAGRRLLGDRGVDAALARRFGVGFAPAGGVRGDALTEYLVRRHGARAEEVAEAGLAHPAGRGPIRDRFRHRLLFPIRDERGQVLGFGGRALGDAVPKYLNTPATEAYDKSSALFGIDQARSAMIEHGAAVLVEGYFDVLAAHAAGVRHAVATSGTALTSAQVRVLARHVRAVVLCFDGDDAGRSATHRAADIVAAEGLDGRIAVLPPGAKDPDDLVRSDPAAFVTCIESAAREWQVLLDRALEGAENGSVDERRAGAERAVALLARIPEATTRELYVQQAARRLDLNPAGVAADVARSGRQGGAAARVVVSMPAPAAPEAAVDAVPAVEPSAWERHIAILVVQRPELARRLLEEHGLRIEELVSPSVRRLVQAAAAAPAGEALALHLLPPADRGLASRALLRTLPELDGAADPAVVTRVLVDCVWRVRAASLEAEVDIVERERRIARDGGQGAEAERLGLRLHRLAEARQRHLAQRTAVGAPG